MRYIGRVPEPSTPALVVDAAVVRRNLERMARYASDHHLKLRPHTKTHKTVRVAKMQVEAGASGLTVAKAGEAEVMAEAADDLLVAYPAVGASRTTALARLALERTVRVAIDTAVAADAIAEATTRAGSRIGILVELDVGFGRTGVAGPPEALALARHVAGKKGLRLDGIMAFPGHVKGRPEEQEGALRRINALLSETLTLWRESGLDAKIVSGGSTPTALQSHHVTRLTEIRPGTYAYYDNNCVRGGWCTLEDCAARVVATVVSDAVPGQVVIDAGSKALTQDRCGPAPESGFGHVVEYPDARISTLTEEHGQIDIRKCDRIPRVGDRVSVIPNHICPVVNLYDSVWWRDGNGSSERLPVDARGRLS